nr:hypothetical protein [uncultured Arsenicibacter sp.]
MNNLKVLPGLVLLILIITSCNRFINDQPKPEKGPSTRTVASLMSLYPQAQNIEFTTIIPDQCWLATFSQHQQRYKAITDSEQVLTTDLLIDSSLPDSLTRLLEPTVIAGGILSNPRFLQYEVNHTVVSPGGRFIYTYTDYIWQQQRYTLYWMSAWPPVGKPFYNINMVPYQPVRYSIHSVSGLPEPLQASLRDQGMELDDARIDMNDKGRQNFVLLVRIPSRPLYEQNWQLFYTSDGKLLAAVNEAVGTRFQETALLPSAIQDYLQRPELNGFRLGQHGGYSGSFARYEFGGITTFAVNVEKDKQQWQMLFSGSGQLIRRSFLTYGSF